MDQPRLLGVKTRWIERAVGSNRIVLFLAGATVLLSVVAGLIVNVIDEEDFPTVGAGVWWAIVTFTTVGYGDIIPTNTVGRIVASIVMVFGITFISLVTALVTSALVTREQRRRQELAESEHPPMHEVLARIERRLEAIERRLP